MYNPLPIRLGSHFVGTGHSPFLVAELSGNHNGSLSRALKIVELAKQAGAHALKIQTYTAQTMTLNLAQDEFMISPENKLWHGKSLYQLYDEAHTPWEWHTPLQKRCQELGLEFFSTPFDISAVDFLESLKVSFYKIASFELVDIPLIRRVAQTGKPIIMSTGMATLDEIQLAVQTVLEQNNSQIILLKCSSAYPAPVAEANLLTIPALKNQFQVHVGLSDHTLGTTVAVTSVALGAVFIEKHFTDSRAAGGVDSAFSLEPEEFHLLAQSTHEAWQSLGVVSFVPTPSEKKSLVFRRSLYFVKDLVKGHVITAQDIQCIRPGLGLAPKHYAEVLGATVAIDVKCGTPVSFEKINKNI